MVTYTVRNLDKRTKAAIRTYAVESNLNIAAALRQLVLFGVQHLKHTEKKSTSFFEIYERVKFKGGKDLSKLHNKVAYGL